MSQRQEQNSECNSSSSPAVSADSREKPAVRHIDLKFSIGSFSSAGVKQENDDTVIFHVPEEPLLTSKGAVFLIADGVSTAEMGKQASAICGTDFIEEYYHTPELWSVPTSAQNTLIALNRRLYAKNYKFTEPRRGYATTLTLIVVKSHHAHLFHVGDSRIYLLRDQNLQRLTTDHSELNQNSYALTRAMGIDVKLQVDYKKVALQEGDLFLFSTDGIHDVLDDDVLRNTLLSAREDATRCCERLAELALEARSRDNLSCLIFQTTELADRDVDDLKQLVATQPFPPPLSVGNKIDGYRVIDRSEEHTSELQSH